MKIKTFAALTILLLTSTTIQAQGVSALRQINSTQITGGDMKALETKDVSFMTTLSYDRLLYFFRQRAGITQPSGCTNYGGWENSDLKGHTLGHYLTAMSLLYAQTGKAAYKTKITNTVKVLRQMQTKMGTGYISAFDEYMLDNVERDGSGWAPYYTLHKILQGLVDAYRYAGNETALTAASEMADYIYERTTRLTDEALWVRNLDIQEVGGFAEAMLNVYMLTGKEEHLKGGQFFQQMDKLLPSAEGRDILEDARTENFYHANSTIPQFIAAEREYEITGNETLLRAAENFWENVTQHRAYANGATSYHEHWNKPQDRIGDELDVQAGETCCTNNLIKLSNDLFRFTRNPKYLEYVERATLGHIMGSIHPETGNFMYFHTQLPGSFKTYGNNTNQFWCCTGTGMENHVRYGQSVCFTDADTMYIAQFFPSKVTWEEQGLTLELQTQFPNEEHVQLRVTSGSSTTAVLKVRIPAWCDDFMAMEHYSALTVEYADGFCIIKGDFCTGDVIDIDLPMSLRMEPLANKPRTYALYYGPMVLAADLGTEGVTSDRVNVDDNYYNGYPSYMRPTTPVPVLTGSADDLGWIQKTEGQMEWTTTATSDGTTLRIIPLYKAVDMRFTDYFTLQGDLSAAPLVYPTDRTTAQPVTELEDGVEYVFQNANETLSCRRFFWDGDNLRTRTSGNLDDLKVVAERTIEGDVIYWSFRITSSANNGRYLGRNNHANVQIADKTLWTATYEESTTAEGNGFRLLLKGDAEGAKHEMMMNADGTWLVAWRGDPGSDYTAQTSHWQFFCTADLDAAAMAAYNAARLRLYQYLREASQQYDLGITTVVSAYNSGIEVYNDTDASLTDIDAAVEALQVAIDASVSLYQVGVPATYGIYNQGFENLSAQHDIESNSAQPTPFGWTVKKNGVEVNPAEADWWWAAINADGGSYMQGSHIWGIWNGNNYGNIELSQTLSGLPNGDWRLTALMMVSGNETNNHARLFINNGTTTNSMLGGSESYFSSLPEGEDCTFSGEWNYADNDLHQRFVVETEVTDGTLTFGVRSDGFFKADDFQLTYLGSPTGIETLNPQLSTLNSQEVYDLQGRKVQVQNIPKGIYIVNGQKYLVK